MSYFESDLPVPRLTIPTTFDPKLVKSSLDELIKWTGSTEPTISDEATLRIALAHAKSAPVVKRLGTLANHPPAVRLAFLRLVPDKYWVKATEACDPLADVMAVIRGLPRRGRTKDASEPLTLIPFAEALNDEEVATLCSRLCDPAAPKVSPMVRSLTERLAAAATTPDLTLGVFRSAHSFDATQMFLRAFTDEQVLQVHAWAMATERAVRTKQAGYTPTALRDVWFELVRRNLATDASLAEHHAELEAGNPSNVLREWVRPLASGGGPVSQFTAEEGVASIRDFYGNVAPLSGTIRAYVMKHAECLRAWDAHDVSILVLIAVAWSPELAALFSPLWVTDVSSMKEDYQRGNVSRDLAMVLTGSPHADAILNSLANASCDDALVGVVAQARTELTNRRALLGEGREEIDFGKTQERDALGLLARFSDPIAVIASGIRSSDPVAVLHAWAIAGAFTARTGRSLPLPLHLDAIAALEKTYGPTQPDENELHRRIGAHRADRLFDQAFSPVVGESSIWTALRSLYRSTANARFKGWIEAYLERCAPDLIEAVPEKLARLVAAAGTSTPTQTRHLVARSAKAPGATIVNRLLGPPIGVESERWPMRGNKKLEHVITLETRLLSSEARRSLGATCTAVAVFVDSVKEGVTFGKIVTLTEEQLASGAPENEGPGSIEGGFALDVLSAEIPASVFQECTRTGAIFELRALFDRRDLLAPGSDSPSWIQAPEDAGTFLFEVDSAFAGELNLGDHGRLYVFDDAVLAQSH